MSVPKNPPREGSRDIGDGILVSRYPDWCRSPDKAIPYDICAYQDEDANTASTVRLTKKRAHTKDSLITCCHGDEAGVGLGVKSGTRGSICQPKTWSETVRFEGKNAVRDNDEWWMNNKNTTGKMVYPIDLNTYSLTPPVDETHEKYRAARYQVAQAAMPVSGGPLPVVIPPVAIPGTLENQKFADAFAQLVEQGANNFSNNVENIGFFLRGERTPQEIDAMLDRAVAMSAAQPKVNPVPWGSKPVTAEAVAGEMGVAAQTNSVTAGNVRVSATSTAGGGGPDCEELRDQIRRALYANKRSPGETDGYHGLLNRIVEQMCGADGPGTPGWKKHLSQLTGSWKRLKEPYDKFKKSECDDSLLSQNERDFTNNILEGNNGQFDPDTITWLGRNHPRCLNFREVIQNGRLSDLLGIIRP